MGEMDILLLAKSPALAHRARISVRHPGENAEDMVAVSSKPMTICSSRIAPVETTDTLVLLVTSSFIRTQHIILTRSNSSRLTCNVSLKSPACSRAGEGAEANPDVRAATPVGS